MEQRGTGGDSVASTGTGSSPAPDAVERLLHRWQERSEGLPAWLLALRRGQADFAVAAKGRPWTIEVRLDGDAPWWVGITAEGEIVCPMPRPGSKSEMVDVRLEGDSCSIAKFMLGQRTLEEAMLDGLVVVPSSSTPLDALERLRRLVAIQFNKLVVGPTAGLLFGRRRLWRFQSRVAEFEGFFEKVGPAFAAAAATIVVSSVAAAAPWVVPHRSGHEHSAAMGTVQLTVASSPTSWERSKPADGVPLQTGGRQDGPTLRSRESSVPSQQYSPEELGTMVGRKTVRTEVDAVDPASVPTGETYLFIELSCDSTVREAVCMVMRNAPRPTPAP